MAGPDLKEHKRMVRRSSENGTPVREQLAEILRREIHELRFLPGQHLIERELCEMTGFSRASIREGLRQLEGEGLVEIVPHKGPRVVKATARQAREIYDVRLLLEGYLGAAAALRATDRDVEELREIGKQVSDGIRRKDRITLIAAKRDFYLAVFRIVGNKEIESVLRKLFGRLSLLWPNQIVVSDEAEEAIVEIEAMVEAIAARDAIGARRAFEAHLRSAQRQAAAFIASGKWDTP